MSQKNSNAHTRSSSDPKAEDPLEKKGRSPSTSASSHNRANPSVIISHELPLTEAPEAYKHFDNRDEGWTKVILHPQAA